MPALSRLIALALASVLVLSACSGNDASTGPTPSAGDADDTAAASPAATLPVASAFGPAAWGLSLPETSEQKAPVVTGNRLVVLDGAAVRAVDAQGKEAWTTPVEGFAADQRTTGEENYPFLRLAAPGVVAVVDGGKVTGDGLAEDRYAVKVMLVDVESGAVVKKVTLPGTTNNIPKPGKLGLAFTLADPVGGGVSAILPDGQVRKLPASTSAEGKSHDTESGATIGNNLVTIWRGDYVQAGSGFTGPGWTSVAVKPGKDFWGATAEAGDADHLLVGRWTTPNDPGNPARLQVQVQVLDAASGKVLSTPKCEPSPSIFVASPDRSHFVSGPMLMDKDGKAQCIGGGTGQKAVTLTAVTDDGRAFGTTGQSLVDLAPDGTVKTLPLPTDVDPPVGIMDGNIAVHWNGNKAIITGNPTL